MLVSFEVEFGSFTVLKMSSKMTLMLLKTNLNLNSKFDTFLSRIDILIQSFEAFKLILLILNQVKSKPIFLKFLKV